MTAHRISPICSKVRKAFFTVFGHKFALRLKPPIESVQKPPCPAESAMTIKTNLADLFALDESKAQLNASADMLASSSLCAFGVLLGIRTALHLYI